MDYDIEKLKEELKDYYGTAAFVMGSDGKPFIPAIAEICNVDEMSDEEIVDECLSLGII